MRRWQRTTLVSLGILALLGAGVQTGSTLLTQPTYRVQCITVYNQPPRQYLTLRVGETLQADCGNRSWEWNRSQWVPTNDAILYYEPPGLFPLGGAGRYQARASGTVDLAGYCVGGRDEESPRCDITVEVRP